MKTLSVRDSMSLVTIVKKIAPLTSDRRAFESSVKESVNLHARDDQRASKSLARLQIIQLAKRYGVTVVVN